MTQDMSNIAPGTYNVTVTDAQGCTGIDTVTVGALALPVPTFTQTGNLLTADQVWPYYQWVLNGFNIPGANSPTYTITQSGIYQLTVTDSSTCPGVSVALTIVGIKELIGMQRAVVGDFLKK